MKMGRAAPKLIRITVLIAALVLAQGCKEREQLEKEAPALAKADLKKERLAIAGVVSDAPTVVDSAAARESWAVRTRRVRHFANRPGTVRQAPDRRRR